MATIVQMAVSMLWRGGDAEDGLKRTAKKTKDAGDAAEKSASIFGKFGAALKGANDIKGAFDMTKGVLQFFVGTPISVAKAMVIMGGELQTVRIRMGLLAGSFATGSANLEKLRQTSRDFGGPLAELVAGFTELKSAGISDKDASRLLRTFSGVGAFLGEGGVGAMAASVSKMAKSGVADIDGLTKMADSGLQVFELLGWRLGATAEEAAAMVKRGAVDATTAIFAMQAAIKSPEAMEMQARFAASFEGQLAKLKAGLDELMKDIGTGMIFGFQIPEFLNMMRAVLEGIQILVKQIVDTLEPIFAGNGDMENTFISIRDMTLEISESLVNAGIDFAASIEKAVIVIKDKTGKLDDGLTDVQNAADPQKWRNWLADWFLPDMGYKKDQMQAEIRRKANNVKANPLDLIAAADAAAEKRKLAVKNAFDVAKLKAAENDLQRWLDQQMEAGDNPIGEIGGVVKANEKKKAFTDTLTPFRDLLLQDNAVTQKSAFDAMQALRGKFNQPVTDNFAARVDANTASAQEAILRNKNTEGKKDLAQELNDLLKLANADDQRALKLQADTLNAIRNIKVFQPVVNLN